MRGTIFAIGWMNVVAPLLFAVEEAPPTDVRGWFAPPLEMAGKLAAVRSPLEFADGSRVATPEDWGRRRAEIRAQWMRVMGPWPPLLERPRVDFLETEEDDAVFRSRVSVEIAPGMMSAGWLLVPAGPGRHPAVFVPYYEPETSIGRGQPQRDFALQLARRGFVALAIGSPGGDARKPQLGGAQCQPLSFLAYVGANCATVLAGLPEVDPARIGVIGHSYGGKWAMFAACLDERFACGVWSDPGSGFDDTRGNINYWDPWYLGAAPGGARPAGLPGEGHPLTGAYREMRELGMDLTELQSLMAPRPFLVSGGSEDRASRWLHLNHVREVYRVLGLDFRVGMTNRAVHDPSMKSNAQAYRFLEYFLRAGGR